MNLVKKLILLLCVALSVPTVSAQDDSDVYNEIVLIRGKVRFVDRPEEPIIAAGQYLVFQRDGCRKCLIATRANADGVFEILVGKGKYKIIAFNPTPPTYDLLAPDQARYVVARDDIEFNIDLIAKHRRDR